MLKRTLSSVVLVLVTVIFFLLRRVHYKLFDIYSYIIAIVCTFELLRAYGDDLTRIQKILVMAFTLTVFPVTSLLPSILIQFVASFVAIILFVSVLTTSLDRTDGITKAVFATFYPTIPLLALVMLNVQGGNGVYYLITALAIPAFTDVGAYLLGSLFKGPKLCPHISPNKTISGAVGGLICGIIATFITYFTLRAFNIDVFRGMKTINIVIFLVVSGIFLSVVAQIGDLVESYLKRRIGIKDMGAIIPGHGGMLDRVDGIAFTSLFTFVIYSLALI